MISFNRTVAYSRNWKSTFLVGAILGFVVAGIIIFLKPFDSEGFTTSYKNLKLAGYGLCVLLPILILHPIENTWYKNQRNRWYLYNELIYVICALFFILFLCGTYAYFVVNGASNISLKYYKVFFLNFGLPFAPVVLPVWWYLRSNFGNIEVPTELNRTERKLHLQGENKQEELTLSFSNFIYAQSQQNYVVVFYLEDDGIQQKMIRSTLSNLMSQIPEAWQVHRSYLVNLNYLKAVEGNARKRFMILSVTSNTIPISQKYYEALKNRLSNSSQKLQN